MFIFNIPGKVYPGNFRCFLDKFYLMLTFKFTEFLYNLC